MDIFLFSSIYNQPMWEFLNFVPIMLQETSRGDKKLVDGLGKGHRYSDASGVTGSGKLSPWPRHR